MVYNIFNSAPKQGDDKMKKTEVRQKIQTISTRIIVLLASITMVLNICLSNKAIAAITWCNVCHSNSVVAEYYNPYFHRYICHGCETVYGSNEEHSKNGGRCTICGELPSGIGGYGTGTGGDGSGTLGLDIDTDLFQPGLNDVGKASEITAILLAVFTVLGAIITVVSIAIIGFNTILGSANEKAEYKEKLVGVIIGAIVLMCGSTIARLLIGLAEAL